MNENINWKKQGICSAHWSKGRRESIEDPSDVVCTEDYKYSLKSQNLDVRMTSIYFVKLRM